MTSELTPPVMPKVTKLKARRWDGYIQNNVKSNTTIVNMKLRLKGKMGTWVN